MGKLSAWIWEVNEFGCCEQDLTASETYTAVSYDTNEDISGMDISDTGKLRRKRRYFCCWALDRHVSPHLFIAGSSKEISGSRCLVAVLQQGVLFYSIYHNTQALKQRCSSQAF